MTEEKIKTKIEKPEGKEEKKTEVKEETKKEPKAEASKIIKKEEAVARGVNLRASVKKCMYICDYIKNKPIDDAIHDLEDVIKLKRIIPFRGEIPHRKGKGMMSGRYPVNTCKELIPVLKGLKGNVLANKMELEKTRITYACPTWASRPSKRSGGRFKRVNILFKAREAAK